METPRAHLRTEHLRGRGGSRAARVCIRFCLLCVTHTQHQVPVRSGQKYESGKRKRRRRPCLPSGLPAPCPLPPGGRPGRPRALAKKGRVSTCWNWPLGAASHPWHSGTAALRELGLVQDLQKLGRPDRLPRARPGGRSPVGAAVPLAEVAPPVSYGGSWRDKRLSLTSENCPFQPCALTVTMLLPLKPERECGPPRVRCPLVSAGTWAAIKTPSRERGRHTQLPERRPAVLLLCGPRIRPEPAPPFPCRHRSTACVPSLCTWSVSGVPPGEGPVRHQQGSWRHLERGRCSGPGEGGSSQLSFRAFPA